MILLTDKAGKRVRYVCGHRSLIVPPVVGVYSRRCDVCHRWTVAEVRRSDLQDRAFIVEVRPGGAEPQAPGGGVGGVVPAPSPTNQQLDLQPHH